MSTAVGVSSAEAQDPALSSDGEDAGDHVGSSDQWVTRCICVNNSQVEGFMIECERCQVWQHGDCVRVDKGKVPDEYFCELCRPEFHDARGLWTGGVRGQNNAKPSVARANSSKKKKSKPKKQSNTISDVPVTTGEGSSAAGTEVAAASALAATVPGLTNQPPSGNGVDDDYSKNLSREERKIVKIMQTIQLMEDRDKKRRRSKGGTTPENVRQPAKDVDASETKRRRARCDSGSKGPFDMLAATLGGYDFEQLKSSPSLLRSLFPVSPMYLGSKVFLMQQVQVDSNPSGGASAPGTPTGNHRVALRHRFAEQYLMDPPQRPHSAVNRDQVDSVSRRSRSRSPSSAGKNFHMSANSSPYSSQPNSPSPAGPSLNATGTADSVIQQAPGSIQVASSLSEPQGHNVSPPPIPSLATPLPPQRAEGADQVSGKPHFDTIPRLSTIPKLASYGPRNSDLGSVGSFAVSPPNAGPHRIPVFSNIPSGPPPPGPAVAPLSNLSELMRTYMNAPPVVSEVPPSSQFDPPRFKPNMGGSIPSSLPMGPRWLPEPQPHMLFPPPTGRYIQPPFSRRMAPPPPFSSNSQHR